MVSLVSIFSFFAPCIVSALFLFIFLEQISYLVKKRNLPGPLFFPPIIGNVVTLLRDPTSFWEKQSTMADTSVFGLSTNYLIGKFIIYIKDAELSNKIFSNIGPEAFQLVGHPFGKKLFGDHSLINMFGEDHKSLRYQVVPKFSQKAQSIYSAIQQVVILRHLRQWEESFCEGSRSVTMRQFIRELNLDTFQTVVAGPYLDEEVKTRIRRDNNLFFLASMALPIDLPGFTFGDGRRAILRLANILTVYARKSIAKMASGEEPACLIDFWTHSIMEMNPLPPYSTEEEIGSVLVDFLFAQDTATASLLWAVVLLESEPEVLRRVREEVASFWSPESNALITADQLAEMKYTRSVAREVIRYRPPATMVPHVAASDFPLTESYTIPKGTIVLPSVFDACFQGFTEPDRFDPDRFSETRQEDRLFKRNFLAFGSGVHSCVGQRYAIAHLMLFIAMFSSLFEFKRLRSKGCDDIVYCPMISPRDGCTVFLSRRVQTNVS